MGASPSSRWCGTDVGLLSVCTSVWCVSFADCQKLTHQNTRTLTHIYLTQKPGSNHSSRAFVLKNKFIYSVCLIVEAAFY